MHEFDNQPAVPEPTRRRPSAEHSDVVAVSRALAEGTTHALDADAVMHLQRTAGNASTAELLGDQPQASPVTDLLDRGGGQPLEGGTRAQMEGALGQDLSDVRVHRGQEAAASAASVQARAYTVGNDVVLGDGVEPGSAAGHKTLAHELTHVLQQRAGPVDGTPAPGGIRVSSPSDPFEQAAESTAEAVTSGTPAPTPAAPGSSAGPSAQRQAGPEEEEEELQGSFLQRQEVPEEEEELQGSFLQRQEVPEEEEEAVT